MFIDTSGLFSLLATDDPHHLLAGQMMDSANRRITHSTVLSEFVTLADARRRSRKAALDLVKATMIDPDVTVIWLDEFDCQDSLALLQARPDKRYSLCDAASFVLMRRLNIREALTTDRHFEQEGFVRLLK